MRIQTKNRGLFLLLALCLGGAAGAVLWLFFFLMDLGIQFLWTTLPGVAGIPFYPVLLCAAGGLLIGLWQSRYGELPETLEAVMGKVKQQGGYPYHRLHILAVSAILPLLFGGSIGPEAGLTGVIAGLCTWIGDRFKNTVKEMKELASVGMAATLGLIFNAPLFGIAAEIEEGDDGETPVSIPKKSKMVAYFAAIFGGFGAYLLLSGTFGGGMGLPRLEAASDFVGRNELLALLPLALLGTLCGFFYIGTGTLLKKAAAPLADHKVIRAVMGGVVLGLMGALLPYTLFSGEHEMGELMVEWGGMTAAMLLVTGVAKLLVLNLCVSFGWRGGNIFPIIFAGVSVGYGMAALLPVEPVYAVAAVTAALVGCVMRKPLAVILLLMLCFPVKGIVYMGAAAVIGSAIPLPGFLREEGLREED